MDSNLAQNRLGIYLAALAPLARPSGLEARSDSLSESPDVGSGRQDYQLTSPGPRAGAAGPGRAGPGRAGPTQTTTLFATDSPRPELQDRVSYAEFGEVVMENLNFLV
jgi:hypothetical protein